MSHNPQFLKNRAAIVTGSLGSGIGRSSALHLARTGADVVLNYGTSGRMADRSDDIARLEDKITQLGARAVVVEADAATREGAAALVEMALSAFGSVDILVNNAGAPWMEQDFADVEPERWERAMAAEITGPALLIGLALPHMRQRRWGRIINIAVDFRTLECLLDAQYGNRLSAYPYPFALGKSARIEMVERLAHAEIRHGITINSILPGIIETHNWAEALERLEAEDVQPPLLAGPDDVARMIVQLCSNAFALATGSRIVIPGNLYQRIR